MENSSADQHENELNLPEIGCISAIFSSVLYCFGVRTTGNLSEQRLRHQHEHPEHLTNLSELPKKYIEAILSFTTPRDVCRLAAVSTLFRSAANSDSVWNKFLPQQCYNFNAVTPIEFASKRELYFRLCDSILIDGGRKIFWLERSTAKIGYMLSARELNISWGNSKTYWRWVSRDDSRFDELSELLRVCWFEVKGEMDCRLLSADTEYRVVFMLKFTEKFSGWMDHAVDCVVTTPEGEEISWEHFLLKREGVADDGWKEVLAGEFVVRAEDIQQDCSSSMSFCMRHLTNWWKSGVLIDGVKIEPVPT